MANDRLEELRRRARERIEQVRESMERGEEVAPQEPPPAPPPRAERRPEPAPARTYDARPSQQTLEGPSLEGPSLEVERPRQPQPEQRALQAQRATAAQQPRAAQAPRQQQTSPPTAHHRGRHSSARQVVNRETLRQAILATEILGKPVSLRSPRENEDL
jgi:hypothetical protein